MAAERILELLKELHGRNKGIEACMVARKGLEGVVMFPESFKEDVGPVWEPLSRTLDEILRLVGKFSVYGLDEICLQTLGFCMAFYVLESSDTALVLFFKKRPGIMETVCGLADEIEDTRKRILEKV